MNYNSINSEIENAESLLAVLNYTPPEQPTHFKASTNPLGDLDAIAYNGQPLTNRMYRAGYEKFFNEMPIIRDTDPLLQQKITYSRDIMQHVGAELKATPWLTENLPEPLGFSRTIIALEPPRVKRSGKLEEGAEFVVAKWGDGFTSPVHGHAPGYEYEEILTGKIRVNSYRMIDPSSNIVRPVETIIAEPGLLVSRHTKFNPTNTFKRQALIHNFVSIGQATSLHYLPEHTRDGRDNAFQVEYFDAVHQPTMYDFQKLSTWDALYQPVGTVILVRSQNVPEYGDHYIVITGKPIMKKHGLRPQDIAISTPHNNLLDSYGKNESAILLKLTCNMQKRFLEFHGIQVINGEVIMPEIA